MRRMVLPPPLILFIFSLLLPLHHLTVITVDAVECAHHLRVLLEPLVALQGDFQGRDDHDGDAAVKGEEDKETVS